MWTSKKYSLSILLNIVLLFSVICLIFLVQATDPVTVLQERDQILRQMYPETDYKAYLSSRDAGLSMSYEEFIRRLYPDQYLDPGVRNQKHMMYLEIVTYPPEEVRLMDEMGFNNTYVRLTHEDIEKYPLLGRLFVADVPFSRVRAYQYELDELSGLRRFGMFLVWNDTVYELRASSSTAGVVLRNGSILSEAMIREVDV